METAISTDEHPTDLEASREKLLVCFARVDDHVEGPDFVLFYTTVVVTMGKAEVTYAGPTDFFLAAGLTLREFDARYRPVDPATIPELAARCTPTTTLSTGGGGGGIVAGGG